LTDNSLDFPPPNVPKVDPRKPNASLPLPIAPMHLAIAVVVVYMVHLAISLIVRRRKTFRILVWI
jgi:hypothetical protein